MRLNKYLAHAGVGSRRLCDSLIEEGKVAVNGSVVTDFSLQVTDDDIIEVNGQFLQPDTSTEVFIVHKPKGYVCTSEDPQGRPKVVDLVKSSQRLFTVGRLDRDTTGVILVTNDGDLAYRLTHPKFRVEKKYYVVTSIDIPTAKLKEASGGIILENGERARCRIRRLDKQGKKILWKVTLSEGKNREIKRIFIALGSKVENLHRFEFAGLTVDNLKPGKFRRLKKNEVKALRELKSR